MAKEEKKVIEMHFPVSFVRDYVHKWMEKSTEQAKNEQERAIFADVVTMIDIAAGVMVPSKKEGN